MSHVRWFLKHTQILFKQEEKSKLKVSEKPSLTLKHTKSIKHRSTLMHSVAITNHCLLNWDL